MAGQGRAQGRVGGRVGTWPGMAGAAPWRLPQAGIAGPLAEKLSTWAAAETRAGPADAVAAGRLRHRHRGLLQRRAGAGVVGRGGARASPP